MIDHDGTHEESDYTPPAPRLDGDDGDPPTFVLVCEECGAEEPAPIDMSPGEVTDCAYCGETATVEAR